MRPIPSRSGRRSAPRTHRPRAVGAFVSAAAVLGASVMAFGLTSFATPAHAHLALLHHDGHPDPGPDRWRVGDRHGDTDPGGHHSRPGDHTDRHRLVQQISRSPTVSGASRGPTPPCRRSVRPMPAARQRQFRSTPICRRPRSSPRRTTPRAISRRLRRSFRPDQRCTNLVTGTTLVCDAGHPCTFVVAVFTRQGGATRPGGLPERPGGLPAADGSRAVRGRRSGAARRLGPDRLGQTSPTGPWEPAPRGWGAARH